MNDIKPDTSLYSDLPNRLRAFAAIIESGEKVQSSLRGGDGRWVDCIIDFNTANSLVTHDVRIKPKPRELWVVYDGTGQRKAGCDSAMVASMYASDQNGWTVVRFMEQPE